MKINYKKIMEVIYDKDNKKLYEIALILYKNDIKINGINEDISNKLKLTFKQKGLLMIKLLLISDIVIKYVKDNLVIDSKDLDIMSKYYIGDDNE